MQAKGMSKNVISKGTLNSACNHNEEGNSKVCENGFSQWACLEKYENLPTCQEWVNKT
jgi:hypothetical protein